MKKNVPWHILAPRRGCFGNHLPLRRVRILAERFLSYRNEVSYTIKKAAAGATTSQFSTTECSQIVHSVVFYFFSLDQKLNPYFVFKA